MDHALLPDEFISRQFRDVTVSAPIFQRSLPGSLELTNLRLIWAGASANFLAPYIDVSELRIAENDVLQLTTSAPDGRGPCTFSLRPFAASAQELFNAIRDCLERARERPNYGVEVLGSNSAAESAENARNGIFSDSKDKENRGAGNCLNQLEVAWTPGLEAALEHVARGQRSGSPSRIEYDAELGVAFEVSDGFDRRVFE